MILAPPEMKTSDFESLVVIVYRVPLVDQFKVGDQVCFLGIFCICSWTESNPTDTVIEKHWAS